MDNTMTTSTPAPDNQTQDPKSGLRVLTPLQLNAIKLDINHTVLTPEYLEKLKG